MIYHLLFLKSLIYTIVIEAVCLLLLFGLYFKKLYSFHLLLLIFTGIICSFATLPYLWFVFPNFIKQRTLFLITGELFVVLVESLMITGILRIKYKHAIMISLICNAISFLSGFLLNNT